MGSNVTKTLGCRMSNGLADAIREEAKKRGRTVNDVMNQFLHERINDINTSPHDENGNLTGENNRSPIMNATEISSKILEKRIKIKELENSDERTSFLSSGDSAVNACVNALKAEIDTLVALLPAEEKEEGFFSFLK